MITLQDGICCDYRKFDEVTLANAFSNRLLNPVLHIEKIKGKYTASLGAKINRNGEKIFIACPSLSHNWILDGGRFKPLPHDVPEFIRIALEESNPRDLRFSDVLDLMRKGIEGIEISVAPEVIEKANIRSLSLFLPSEIPGLNATLYPYQERGAAWVIEALETIGGAILADEMGLGKTLQVITVLLLNKPLNDNPALIVCPTTLIANWCREIKKFGPSFTFLVHRGGDRTGYYKDLMRSQIVITTYDTLANDVSLFRGVEWKYLICDEAQAVKNPDSKRRKALSRLSRRYTIPVTGTPVENTLLDLWSLIDLAVPRIVGTKESFLNIYPDTEIGSQKLSTISDAVILKRQVKDVANDLPVRTDIDFPVELDAAAKNEYERIRIETIAEYGVAGRLVAVGQLAIYCAHPWLRSKKPVAISWDDYVELEQDTKHSLLTPKMELCIQILKEALLTNKKVLIFVAYNNCGDLIKVAAEQEKAPAAYWNTINGSTPQGQRQHIVDTFSKVDGPAVLVLNPKAAGSGLNITAATIVIHYTQNWNPALEMQASARAHRRGQEQPVTIYRLFYEGTVEETMVERSQWKRELGEAAIPISVRDKQDLEKAISVNPLMEYSNSE
ncbi:MAG: DEAD/DEAH box helicase [Candidatus Marinimicrobia bacterium]|jgi:SNF2 family DNA or RNA helicase|nr:DEAD/DEAH box helicase [Candidatus Neomarinimicrobiota bacterium]MBT5271501.1 DEAD/DEAH box helicase [Candidatus Neomarinimicrobiota bacterium]MBT6010932.1 DEAD/DEAH box helicase [Candidatus Neomarinimicrobiota bacterium]